MTEPDCNHADMLRTDTEWVCHCGLTIERRPDRESYLAAARAALQSTTAPTCAPAAPNLTLVSNPSRSTTQTATGESGTLSATTESEPK